MRTLFLLSLVNALLLLPGAGWSGQGGWGGQGWNNGWGSVVQYRGGGRGDFNWQRGPNYKLRGVQVTMDRAKGLVDVAFDTNAGPNTLSFTGRIRRVNGDTVEADIISCRHLNRGVQSRGVLRLRVAGNRRVQMVDVSGDINNGQFNLNWRG